MEWYTRITSSLIGNPARPRVDGRGYAALAGQSTDRTKDALGDLGPYRAPETTGYTVRMPPVHHPQGERPVRDLQGGTDLFEDFDMFTSQDVSAPARAPSTSPAPEPTQETAEEPAQEPSKEPSQEPVDTQVHSSTSVDPSPARAPSTSRALGPTKEPARETAEEPAQEPSHHPSQEPVDTQI
ncbi:early nodulin-like protein 1 [Lycium ferocissimum]|uniref:early nodulin-like protein 1 n=1 Tax=Lycium ferocissimum TaxID=112874 RepID=UPI00281568EA|nr:early nodulin-like protein 1 [Lycium ferocissimum]